MKSNDEINKLAKKLNEKVSIIKKDLEGEEIPRIWETTIQGKKKIKIVKRENGRQYTKTVDPNSNEFKTEFRKIILARMLRVTESNLYNIEKIKDNLAADDWGPIVKWADERYESISKDLVQQIIYDYHLEKWNGKKGRKPFIFAEAGSDLYNEHKIMKSSDDIAMRSKSEIVISEKLQEYGIIFEYEQTIIVDGVRLHPDFFIVKGNGDFVIWEHIGRTFDDSYLQNQLNRLVEYKRHGFVPWKNLIITFDGEDGSFDAREVEFRIKNNLLR